MKQRIAVAAVLAVLAGASFAQESVVNTDQSCPKGTYQLVPAYSFEGGRLVETGKVCKDLLIGD
jgi:hypothetical protein